MELKFVEAGHPVDAQTGFGGNWGKFAVGRWSNEELREKTKFPGCEGQYITSLRGHGMTHVWLFDLQTGEGARFHTNNPIPVDVRSQLKDHQIWVCPMFEPFMVWLWHHMTVTGLDWWEHLPRTIELPDAPFDTAGYRRAGPDAAILERFERIEELLAELLGGRHTSGGVPLTDKVIADLAADAEAGYLPDKLTPHPDAGRPRTDEDVRASSRRLTYRSLDTDLEQGPVQGE